MKQFDPYGGAECGIGLLHIDFDNLSRSNTVLSINIITPNVTVRSPIYQPMVMPIMFNNRCHDAIGMYECPAHHPRRTAFPNLTCCFPYPLCVGLIVRVHLKELRMSFAHCREHLKVKYISVRALGVRVRAMVTVTSRVMVRVKEWG